MEWTLTIWNGCLTAAAVWLGISALDDLLLFLLWLVRKKAAPDDSRVVPAPRPPIAIFVPLWQEEAVVGRMVEHNISAAGYGPVHFFLGIYPNDAATGEAAGPLEDRFDRVHLAYVPHDGPTSKADCLNWIYQRMLLYEEQAGIRFTAVVTHDAEDLIHPKALERIASHLSDYDMIQVPVLPLPTPVSEWTHGVYIDEFVEFQCRDLPIRCQLGGFLPSAGVGTAFSRRALEALAASSGNRIFEPACLTEDYENGFRIHSVGMRQILLPLDREPVATREYFPRTVRAAVRQRTRWYTGIIWQGWERHGWQGGASQWWWHWRDRKSAIGSPAALLANGAMVVSPWVPLPETVSAVAPLLLAIVVAQALARAVLVSHLYGWGHGVLAPFRIPFANAINSAATVRAAWRYWGARLRGEPLVWLKTAHQYPNRFTLEAHRPTLGEVLVGNGFVTSAALERAVADKPRGIPLTEWLLRSGVVEEPEIYEALSLQLGTEIRAIPPEAVAPSVARCLPAAVQQRHAVLPVGLEGGEIILASARPVPPAVLAEFRIYTQLGVRVELVTASNFDALCRAVR